MKEKKKRGILGAFFETRCGKKIAQFSRKIRALYLYYKHVWKLSSFHAGINSFFRATYQELSSFNLLNAIFAVISKFFGVLGLKNISRRLRFFVQEQDASSLPGVNRFVLVRYLLKELFLYFFIAFLFFFMVFFVNQIHVQLFPVILIFQNGCKKFCVTAGCSATRKFSKV